MFYHSSDSNYFTREFYFYAAPMTCTRSTNDNDIGMGGEHGQMISGGAGHSSGHAVQADDMPQTFRQGIYAAMVEQSIVLI